MRAHQIMTPRVVTARVDMPIAEAADLMLRQRISGLPVVDARGKLVGVVSEGDFLRRTEIGTGQRRTGWLEFFTGAGKLASEFVREEGRRVQDVMTPEPATISADTTLEEIVRLMEKKGIKRLPVLRGEEMIGIVTRANLLQAVANLARGSTEPTASDDEIRNIIMTDLEKQPWCPMALNAVVRDGVVDLSGVITDNRQRKAAVVAARNVPGVKAVHDCFGWIDTMSGTYIAPQDTPKIS